MRSGREPWPGVPFTDRRSHSAPFSPNVVHGGVKTNVIPDSVELEVDIRTLPGQTEAEIRALLHDILGELSHDVTIDTIHRADPSVSPMDTPLWDSLARVTGRLIPNAELIPGLIVGGTDAKFFREVGTISYGFGLFSSRLTAEAYSSMFHGNDERDDVDSLQLSSQLWDGLARDLLAP